MRSHFSHEIQFVKYRRVLFAISIVLVVLAIVGVIVRGINLGVEFSGGTQVSFNDTGDVTISQMRDAFAQAGVSQATVQTSDTGNVSGFLVGTPETDPTVATEIADQVAASLGLGSTSYQVTTIGPNWGANVTRSSIIAFVVVIALIVAFVSWRYEFKMSLMAVVSLLHVIAIVVGIYAWTQLEVNPNVVAALLTIMGFCLYDTVVVFNRVNENIRNLRDGVHRTALQITNYSENQIIIRSINTTLTSLIPVIAMLIFGGDTLKGFAFAMLIGLSIGSYSSIAIAAPLYALWKTREEEWARAEKLYGEHAQQITAAEPAAVVEAIPASVEKTPTPAPANASKPAKRRNKNSGKVR